jgi:hypothetical protein
MSHFNLVLEDSTADPLSRGLPSNLPPYKYVAEVGEILRKLIDEMFRLVDGVKLDRIGEDRASERPCGNRSSLDA